MKVCWSRLHRRLKGRSPPSALLYLLVAVVLLAQLQPLFSSLFSTLAPKSSARFQHHHQHRLDLSLLRLLGSAGSAGDRAGHQLDNGGASSGSWKPDTGGRGGGGGDGVGSGNGSAMWFNPPDCSVVDFLASPDPSARAVYNTSLVCGERARDRDVMCSLFFAQIGLTDDGDCKRKTDDTKVPRIVYFVIFGDYTFQFWHYVSVMAAKRHVSPSALYVIGDAHPLGYWWKRLLRDCKGVRFIYRARPKDIGRQKVTFKHHLSDLVRLQTLLLNGGIYLDADMVVTRPLDPLLSYDITMGLIENGTGMGNAFIAAKRNSDFVREWYDHYNVYNASQFYTNSLHVPRDMWHKNPGRLHMESERLYKPNWFEADKLFKRGDYDWSRNYAVHVWTNGNPVPRSEEEIQTANTTIAQVFRNALYGDPRPRRPSEVLTSE